MSDANDEPCDGFAPEGRRPSPNVLAHLNPPVVFLGRARDPADPVVAALARALAERDALRVAAAEALGFVRYALEFFDWARFPALESSVEKLRDDLARVAEAKAG